MKSYFDWVSRNVFSYKEILVFSFLLAVVFGVQGVVVGVTYSNVTTWQGTCVIKGLDDNDLTLGVLVDCGSKGSTTVTDTKFVYRYLKNAGPVRCSMDLNDSLSCEPRPDKA